VVPRAPSDWRSGQLEYLAMAIGLKYLRIFVDVDGLSHFEDCELPMGTRDFAALAAPVEATTAPTDTLA